MIENSIPKHGFKDVADEQFSNGKPLNSVEFASRIGESITEELVEFGNLTQGDAAEIGIELEKELKEVANKSDQKINEGDSKGFNQIRSDVSVIVGEKVLPTIFEKYGVDNSFKDKIGVGNLMRLAVQGLQSELFEGETDTAQWSVVSKMSAKEMRAELINKGVIKEDEYLSEDFGQMPDGEEFENSEQITAASIMTMNAAWKTVQLGRGVSDNLAKKDTDPSDKGIERITVGGNYGTFQEMLEAMYKIGFDKSGGDSKIGLIRAIFELAKDLKQIYKTKI